MSRPLFSVVVPTYNYGAFLPQCIESVLGQDFDDWELVICDDQSTDASDLIVRGYADPRIRYCRNPTRLGMYPNFRRAVERSAGVLVKPLSADDYLLPTCLTTFRRAFDDIPDLAFATCGVEVCDWRGEVFDRRLLPGAGRRPSLQSVAELVASEGCVFGGNSLYVFSREAYDRVGGYPPDVPYSGDFALAALLARCGAYYSIPEVLVGGRLHGVQSGVRDTRGTVHIEDRFKIYRVMFGAHPQLRFGAELRRRAETRETALYTAIALRSLLRPTRRAWAFEVLATLKRQSSVPRAGAVLRRLPALAFHFVRARKETERRLRLARRTARPGMPVLPPDPSLRVTTD
jgi:hypothetical protein